MASINPPRTLDLPLQPYRLHTTSLSGEESFEVWRDIVCDTYLLYPPSVDEPSMRLETTVWPAGKVLFAEYASEANRVHRSPDLIAKSPGRYLKLRLFHSGGCRISDEKSSAFLGPGAVHLIDQSREVHEFSTDHRQSSAFIPHALIGYDPARHPAWLSYDMGSPVGRVLADSLLSVFGQLPQTRLEEAPLLGAGFAGLVRGLIAGGLDSMAETGIRASRAEALRRFIDDNLHDPELGIEKLQTAFAAARATIYRDFAEVGGVSRYITDRRLERSYRELAESPSKRGTIQSVAEKWSFASVSHFSRLFREKFRMSPSEVLGLSADGQPMNALTAPALPRWNEVPVSEARRVFSTVYENLSR